MHHPQKRGGRRLAAGVAFAALVATILVGPPALADETDGTDEIQIDDGQVQIFDQETGEEIVVPPAPQARMAGAGYNTLGSYRNNYKNYTVRLVNSPNIESYRGAIQAVANHLRSTSSANLTVAAGLINSRATQPAGEIDVSTAAAPITCGSATNAVGCTTSNGLWRADGKTLIMTSAKIVLDNNPAKYPSIQLADLTFHEFGHAMGLAHYDGTFNGQRQVMYPSVSPIADYQTGDVNGTKYLSYDPPAIGSLDTVTPSEGKLRLTGWTLDPDRANVGVMNVTVDGVVAWSGNTSVARSDVNSAQGVSGKFGFDQTIPTIAGAHTVCLNAFDFPSGTKRQIACKSVTVPGVVPTPKAIQGGWSSLNVTGTGDFNGDGHPDVLSVNSTTGALTMHSGNGAGGFLSPTGTTVGTGWAGFKQVVGPADFNGDKKPDMLAIDSSGALLLYAGNGAGGWLTGHGTQIGTGWSLHRIAGIGDFNGDGKADVLSVNTTNGALLMYAGDGKGGWINGAQGQIGSGWGAFTQVVGPADFTGDGKPDVLAINSSGALMQYAGNGSGGWLTGSAVQIATGWTGSKVSGIVDFDGDGKVDILYVGADNTLYMLRGDGRGGAL